MVVKRDFSRLPFKMSPVVQADAQHTEMGWEVFPAGLTEVLTWVKERYGDIPLYVTENGSAFADPPSAINARVEDPLRVAYLEAHLKAIRDAITKGVNLRGYFAWSLLDNYEWSYGYTRRFGIVHVDYQTQERTIKDSGRFYSRIIQSNGTSLG
jgi:beta-glucosidase